MKASIKYVPFLVFAVLYIGACVTIFHFIDEPPKSDDINLVNRGIDSSIRLWLNGYLGLFFGFRFLGTINWLVLPLVACFIFIEKKMERWMIAFLLFYVTALLLIISQGYFNSRYQITLLPLTISMVAYLAWNFAEQGAWKQGKYFLMILFFTMTMYNDWKYFVSHTPGTKKMGAAAKSGTTANTRNYTKWLNPLPVDLVDFLGRLQIDENSKMLVNNVPLYFYYCDKPGVYCWCGDDVYYDAHGAKPMMKDLQGKEFSGFLRNELRCKYIVTASSYAGYSKPFDEYVSVFCKLILTDKNGYLLYEINAD